MAAQAKLLRFLENGEFYRLGGTKKYRVQARIVSATNKDLEEMIQRNDFRRDLFFRLSVVKVKVPSLNRRREDILPLARYFLTELNRKHGKAFSGISLDAENALKQFHWDGNVRQLKSVIERGILVAAEPILTTKDLGLRIDEYGKTQRGQSTTRFASIPPSGVDLSNLQDTQERHYIEEALRMADGNESKAARLLNLNHHTFRYRRKKLQKS
jgi:DNA-binding NtrC family response regulator